MKRPQKNRRVPVTAPAIGAPRNGPDYYVLTPHKVVVFCYHSGMNTYFGNTHNISDTERAAFKKALAIYYTRGGPIADAFAQVEPGLVDRYYRRKKAYPDEMADIEREAQDEARGERSFERLGFEARQERLSWEMQESASEVALELIDELVRIAKGEPRVVEITGGDGFVEYKSSIPYPRDQIAAAKALLDIARYGLLPANWKPTNSPGEQKENERVGLMPLFSGNTAFKTISAVTPDGKIITATVDDPEIVVTEPDDGVDGD
jgi:hypothetical protein